MNRQACIMLRVYKSEEKSQTYCWKEERFTVQNKLTDASPIRDQPRKASPFNSTQVPIHQKEKAAVQNKKTGGGATTIRSQQTLPVQSDTSRIRNENPVG
jgi:hypothetical protein